MCGRFTLVADVTALARKFLLENAQEECPEQKPRYNITPGGPVATVLHRRDDDARHLDFFTWGLVPSWAKDPKIAYKLINARAESAAQKPAFRSAMKYRRCLVPASGFYEWRRQPNGKQPFYFTRQDDEPFAFAGLWEHKQFPDGSEILSCCLLTTEPNELMEPVHDRCPVILTETDYERWLDPEMQKPDRLKDLLGPWDPQAFRAYPVSPLVNSPRNEGSELIEPAEEFTQRQQTLFDDL